jgi:hypothetical protein
MTNKALIDHIKTTNKFPMTFDDYTNYFILIFPMAFICIGLVMAYNYFHFEGELDILLVSVLLIIIGLFFTFFTYLRLKQTVTFESIITMYNNETEKIADKLRDNFKLRNINVDKELGLVIAYTKMTTFSWGEKLTLLIDKNTILINSRPSGIRHPVTIFKDKLNIKKFKEIIN